MAKTSIQTTFVVEEAGCDSCAARVRSALEPLGSVQAIDVDHAADVATVRLDYEGVLSEETVNRALKRASEEAGHTYRVKPGSFGAP